MDPDPAPDPAIFVIDPFKSLTFKTPTVEKTNLKKRFFYFLLFDGTFTSNKR
jgi:hypothetical protein